MIKTYDTRFKDGLPSLIVKEEFATNVNCITNPNHVFSICHDSLGLHLYTEEYVYLFGLNTKGHVLGVFEVGHGTVSRCLISGREIFIRLLLIGATNFIVVHNHPSGDIEPSVDDHKATDTLKKQSELLGIPMLDHIVIAGESYFSFSENLKE